MSPVVEASAASVSLQLEVPDPDQRFEGGKLPVLQLILGSQLAVGSLPVNIPWGGGSSTDKASAINTALIGAIAFAPMVSPFKNATTTIDPTTPGTVNIGGLPKKTKVTFKPGKSGEGMVDPKTKIGKDIIKTAGDPTGAIGFQNSAFDSIDAFGNPSTFTAGVVTDFGQLFATVDADHLANLQGATIVQALFQLLNPSLAGFGAQIVDYSVGDDVLNFFFDPAKTQTAGVIFGTTALSDGLFGTLEAGEVPEPELFWLLGGGMVALMLLYRRQGGGLQKIRCAARLELFSEVPRHEMDTSAA